MALSGDKYTHLVWSKKLNNKSKEELNTKTLTDIHMNHTIWDVEELSFQNFSRRNAGLYTCTNTKCNKSVVIKLVMIGTVILFYLSTFKYLHRIASSVLLNRYQ